MFPLKLEKPLVVFDIESTGTSPRKDRIIELAAIKVMPDGSEESRCWLLNPTVPIPPETTAIHGISDEIVALCPTFADKAEEIFGFFLGCDLSGFNADRFDIPCLEEEFARVGLNFAASSRRHVDVQRIYHRMEPRDLTAAVRFYCDRDHAGAHGAEADTRATLDVLKAQMAKYPSLPKDIAAMDEYLVPRDPLNADRNGLLRWMDGELCINFGKKKGDSLRRLLLNEPNYLRWIVKGDFDSEVRMIVKDLLDNGRLPPAPK
ncbi:MAG: 3'-5' exonuclease [Kiritimatiellae bacterium]|nr:3'-5' exonuclease [Kiritimatiellia bacterium]MBR4476142.1 3'-5' exonuclease [Kiritimatiellia bacterium]